MSDVHRIVQACAGAGPQPGDDLAGGHLAPTRVGRDANLWPGKRLGQELVHEPGERRPVGRAAARQLGPGRHGQAGRELPQRLIAERQRARLRGRRELPGDEDVVVAEHRVDGRANAGRRERTDRLREQSRVLGCVEVGAVVEGVGV